MIPNFINTGVVFDVKTLRHALNYCGPLFNDIKARQEYPGSAHHSTKCIFVRGPKEFTADGYQESLDSVWNYKVLASLHNQINPILDKFTKELQITELGRVLIVQLNGKSALDEHIDEGYYADYYTRFHIPVVTTKKAFLTVGGEDLHMNHGECWWFNHKKPHWGRNENPFPRIHLIIDAVSEKFKHPNDME